MTLLGRRKEKDAMKLENGVTFAFPILVFLWKGPQRHMDVQCVHQAPALQSSYPIDLIKYSSSSWGHILQLNPLFVYAIDNALLGPQMQGMS